MALPASSYLQELILRAIDLDDLKEAGATFAYPAALRTDEWMALKLLGRARRKEQARQMKPKTDAPEAGSDAAAAMRKRKLHDQMNSLPPIRR